MSAMVELLERAKLVVEGAGAVGLAALLAGRHRSRARRSSASSPGATSTRRCCRRSCGTGSPPRAGTWSAAPRSSTAPGSLGVLLGHLADDRINIVDVEHHREGVVLGVTDVEVELTLETRDRDHCVEVLESLRRRGYEVERVR